MSERNLVLLESASTLTVKDVKIGETDRNSERKGKERKGKEVPSLSFSAEALKIEIISNQIKCSFLRREENGSIGRKTPLRAEKSTNKLNAHMTTSLGIQPRPHWWEASALTNAIQRIKRWPFARVNVE